MANLQPKRERIGEQGPRVIIQWDKEGHIVARSSEKPQGNVPHLCTIKSILTLPLLAFPLYLTLPRQALRPEPKHKTLGFVLGKVK